jgi:hypothetical protein
VATASHQVLPLCCSAFCRPAAAIAALKAWVSEDLLDRTMTGQPVRSGIPACGPRYRVSTALRSCVVFATHNPVGAEGYV